MCWFNLCSNKVISKSYYIDVKVISVQTHVYCDVISLKGWGLSPILVE